MEQEKALAQSYAASGRVCTHKLGNTSLALSSIGFGASPFAGGYGVVSQIQANEAVDAAIEAGINFFDTAPWYSSKDGTCRSEEILGIALSRHNRDKFIINTKACRYPDIGSDFTAERLQNSVKESLARLKLTYFDMLTIHDVEFAANIDQVVNETIPAAKQLQREGIVKYIGISGYPIGILLSVAQRIPIDFVLSYCHFNLQNTLLADLINDFTIAGAGIINASPLSMGLLSTNGPPDFHPAPDGLKAAAKSASELCLAKGVKLSDIAIQFALHHELSLNGKFATTLIGFSNKEEVAAAFANLKRIPDTAIVEQIQNTLKPYLNYSWPSGNSHKLERKGMAFYNTLIETS